MYGYAIHLFTCSTVCWIYHFLFKNVLFEIIYVDNFLIVEFLKLLSHLGNLIFENQISCLNLMNEILNHYRCSMFNYTVR